MHWQRAAGIISDAAAPTTAGTPGMDLPSDAHIIINAEGAVLAAGVEEGVVLLQTNDDFAMDAPSGASGQLDGPLPPASLWSLTDSTGAGQHTPCRADEPPHDRAPAECGRQCCYCSTGTQRKAFEL